MSLLVLAQATFATNSNVLYKITNDYPLKSGLTMATLVGLAYIE